MLEETERRHVMRKIALEEAVAVPGQEKLVPGGSESFEFQAMMPVYDRLVDLTEERLRHMDATGIEISVLSVTSPGTQGLPADTDAAATVTQWNDYVATAISEHRDRLACFAALPMRDPDAAITELRRYVTDLGCPGALVNGYDDGTGTPLYYDAPQYLDFWHTAEELGVPLYIHPRSAPPDHVTTYNGYPQLDGAAWGFHVETAEHILRLILSGLFDTAPRLQIILGHMGEILPWWAWRLDHRLALDPGDKLPLARTVTEYLQQNFYITTSGFFHTPALEYAVGVLGPDRVLYSVDYPYESCEEAGTWLDKADLPDDLLRKIAFDNAARLLKLG
ncbi:amidohydrolase family protein [Streptomyces olivoreticuli]|uniref:amidohydrolase family protein n=1 Tax=Streptomyces olivoreticuli TaxID=68246 RepID=UPI002658C5CA|nr:amidohydrolase family protein [Streptomyces olivoreticuli]WKK23976.1 amidohydrolase family protein [Streptomyces olivoreticuli]